MPTINDLKDDVIGNALAAARAPGGAVAPQLLNDILTAAQRLDEALHPDPWELVEEGLELANAILETLGANHGVLLEHARLVAERAETALKHRQ